MYRFPLLLSSLSSLLSSSLSFPPFSKVQKHQKHYVFSNINVRHDNREQVRRSHFTPSFLGLKHLPKKVPKTFGNPAQIEELALLY